MSNIVYLEDDRTRTARDLQHAAQAATAAVAQILAAADILDCAVEQIEDPILREATRKRNREDRDLLRASVAGLREKVSKLA
jgi:methionine synthase II (cobalamin-independent)